MNNYFARLVYKWLVKYCRKHGDNCGNCIFNDNRPKCMCIANIPSEWYKPTNS